MVCDENNVRKRRGSGRTDPADHPPFFVGILYNPSEEKDLAFLKQVCGEQLDQPMGLSQVEADEEGNLIRVEGILRPYSQKIVRKRLRKRYVLAEVGLFGRQETVLFGICLPGDRIWEGRR